DGGLSRWNKGRFENFTTRDGLSNNSIVSIYEDNHRELWIGTKGGGLNRMRNVEGGTRNNSELRTPNSAFSIYTTKQGLFSDDIFEILEDNYGYLWMSCLKGIFRVSKNELDDLDRKKILSINCTAYGKVDGLTSIQCNGV